MNIHSIGGNMSLLGADCTSYVRVVMLPWSTFLLHRLSLGISKRDVPYASTRKQKSSAHVNRHNRSGIYDPSGECDNSLPHTRFTGVWILQRSRSYVWFLVRTKELTDPIWALPAAVTEAMAQEGYCISHVDPGSLSRVNPPPNVNMTYLFASYHTIAFVRHKLCPKGISVCEKLETIQCATSFDHPDLLHHAKRRQVLDLPMKLSSASIRWSCL